MARERVEAFLLVYALGLVGEQHRVAVECDAYLIGVPARRLRRLRVDARSRNAGVQRAHDVELVGRQEQVSLQRIEVAVGVAPARKYPPLQAQPGAGRRAEYPQP